jgi:hypothetical protein
MMFAQHRLRFIQILYSLNVVFVHVVVYGGVAWPLALFETLVWTHRQH